MKVIVVWQSLVVKSYRSFFSMIPHTLKNSEVTLIAPRVFSELGQQAVRCFPFDNDNRRVQGFCLRSLSFHVQAMFLIGLPSLLKKVTRTDLDTPSKVVILSIAEPYSLTALWNWLICRLVIKDFIFVSYSAQNILKKFPVYFAAIQRLIFSKSTAILCTGVEQANVLKAQGYKGFCVSFPLWYDSTLFFPRPIDQSVTALVKHLDNNSRGSGQILEDVLLRQPTEAVFVIGFAGTLSADKGLPDLLDALEIIFQNSKYQNKVNILILIAGRGDLQSEIQQWCGKRWRQGVHAAFLKALPAPLMPYFFSLLDVLVVPSRTTPYWKEQFGRVIVEAWACGALVAGSISGEIPQVIADARYLFKERDSVDMARVLENMLQCVLENQQELEMGRLAVLKNAHENYSDDALSKKFANYLQSAYG